MNNDQVPVTQEYRKTATIKASQWWQDGDHPATIKASQWWQDGDHPAVTLHNDIDGSSKLVPWIDTLEGGHIVTPGDWIATGVKGEHWPIKPDIFAESYVPVDPEGTTSTAAKDAEIARMDAALADIASTVAQNDGPLGAIDRIIGRANQALSQPPQTAPDDVDDKNLVSRLRNAPYKHNNYNPGASYFEVDKKLRNEVMDALQQPDDVVALLKRCLEREYNAFEPDNQSALYNDIESTIASMGEGCDCGDSAITESGECKGCGARGLTR